MGTEINLVIDNLCNKLGMTVDNLIPELARYHIAMESLGIVLFVGIFLISLLILHNAKNRPFYDDSRDFMEFVSAALVVGSIIGIVVLIILLVGWIASPIGAGVSELLHMIRK